MPEPLQSSAEQRRRPLTQYVVRFNPPKFPGRYVVEIVGPEGVLGLPLEPCVPKAVTHTLEAARAAIPAGFRRMGRVPQDPEYVVEVWV